MNAPDGVTPYNQTSGYSPAYDIPLGYDLAHQGGDSERWADRQRQDHSLAASGRSASCPATFGAGNDPNYNPYRTIDTMPMDLTALNGIVTAVADPQVTTAITNNPSVLCPSTRTTQRPAGTNNLWRQEPLGLSPMANIRRPTSRGYGDFCFQLGLNHSLGYLNDPFGPA